MDEAIHQGHVGIFNHLVTHHPRMLDLRASALLEKAVAIDPKSAIVRQLQKGMALQRAALWGDQKNVLNIVQKDAFLAHLKDKNGRTPLTLAAKSGHEAVVDLLLREAPKQDATALIAPFYAALENRNLDVLQHLVAHGVELDERDADDLLRIAVRQGHGHVFRQVISQGKHTLTVPELLKAISKEMHGHWIIDQLKRSAELQKAVLSADSNKVHTLLEKHARQEIHIDIVNLQHERGTTPLGTAANKGLTGIVSRLLEEKANVNAFSARGRTAINAAASKGHTAIVQMLLEHGALIHDRDIDGKTPIMNAARNNHAEVVAMLLEQGAFLQSSAYSDQERRNLFHIAKDHKSTGVLRVLQHAQDLQTAVASGNSQKLRNALNHMKQETQRQILRSLINAPDDQKRTPLAHAASKGNIEMVRMLVRNGGNPELHSVELEKLAKQHGYDTIQTMLSDTAMGVIAQLGY